MCGLGSAVTTGAALQTYTRIERRGSSADCVGGTPPQALNVKSRVGRDEPATVPAQSHGGEEERGSEGAAALGDHRGWAVSPLRSFSSLLQSVRHLKQIKSLWNKQARRYRVGSSHSGGEVWELDGRTRGRTGSLSGDNAPRSNQDCSNIEALVIRPMNGCTKEAKNGAAGWLQRQPATSSFISRVCATIAALIAPQLALSLRLGRFGSKTLPLGFLFVESPPPPLPNPPLHPNPSKDHVYWSNWDWPEESGLASF